MRRSFVACCGLVLLVIVACNGELRFGSPSTLCSSDSDCPLSTLHCDTVSGDCVQCADDSQCASQTAAVPTLTPRCDSALHLCVVCGSDQDCPPGLTCADTHRCEACNSMLDASAPEFDAPYFPDVMVPFFEAGSPEAACFACESDQNCPGRVCDIPSGVCVECTENAQCNTGHCQLALGTCVECVLSTDCGGAQPVCDPTSWTCVP